MFQDRRAFHPGINNYVPAMNYSAALIHGQPTEFSLGIPLVQSATRIVTATPANSVANTITMLDYTMDSPYGRNITVAISADPGNTCVHDIVGFDYLGQPMVERYTGGSGVTAILYGLKAFKKVSYIKTITPSTNAVTFNIGTGTRLGLPFKGDIIYAKELNVLAPLFKRDFIMATDFSVADAIAGVSHFIQTPCPGFVKRLIGTPFGGGSTTDPVITAEIGGTAITGLTVTIDVSNAAGLTVVDTPTTPGYNANNRLFVNGLVEIVAAAAAGAGGYRVGVDITPTQFSLPDLTDPATANTGDPRGTYEPIGALNGVNEHKVGLSGDNSVNAAGNGGLLGIRHYFA